MTETERKDEIRQLWARLRDLMDDDDVVAGIDFDLFNRDYALIETEIPLYDVNDLASQAFSVLPGAWHGAKSINPYFAMMKAMMAQSLGEPSAVDRAERFSARLSKDQKALLERAAELQDRTLTDFVMSAAQSEAERVVWDRMAVTLSAAAFDAFADACISANGEPNEALRNAAQRQKKRVRST